ncbi:LysE family transporter [Neorhizobium galegae]|uniref:LysE family transporter n=1 Tax=Neorhizobium galegae TaxID=399 RepID=UPI000621870C|nr:LysE family transporter [Neorhizobium galegae]CDZ54980.1 Putative threonine efflux protein [Neorhizobium galegae bv. orientalis]
MPMLTSFALSYALVLIAPGSNLLVVLRVAVKPSWGRLLSVSAGIASGASVACYLAAVAATNLTMLNGLTAWGSAILSLILLYSAVRLARGPTVVQPSQEPGSDAFNLKLYSLGLATALSNPLSVPFFVSVYLTQPDFRGGFGGAVSGAVFVMALAWFTFVGRVFSVSAIQRLNLVSARAARFTLAAAMGAYALKLLYDHLL